MLIVLLKQNVKVPDHFFFFCKKMAVSTYTFVMSLLACAIV